MTRDEARKWFEGALADCPEKFREPYQQALEALMQPVYVAVKQGEVAILRVNMRHAHPRDLDLFKEAWSRHTGCAPIIMDDAIELVGSAPAAPGSPAVEEG